METGMVTLALCLLSVLVALGVLLFVSAAFREGCLSTFLVSYRRLAATIGFLGMVLAAALTGFVERIDN